MVDYTKIKNNINVNLRQINQIEKESELWHNFVKKYILTILQNSGNYTTNIIEKSYVNNDLTKTINNLRKIQREFGINDDLYSKEKALSKAYGLVNQLKRVKKLKDMKFNSVLDFGGGDGNIVYHIGKLLKIDKDNTYVSDILTWSGVDWESKLNKEVKYIHSDKLNEIKIKFDLIIISHTLHHIKDDKLFNYIEQLINLLNPNGIILLKEHDCSDKEEKKKFLIDLEHILYDTVVSQTSTYSAYKKTYYSKFRSKNEWENIFNKLKSLYYYYKPYSKDFTYFQIFEKK
jgi:2-polyprenyl-3-methyl-5-hydroxy-6-metoxy-1,4-benzoquinol methylase